MPCLKFDSLVFKALIFETPSGKYPYGSGLKRTNCEMPAPTTMMNIPQTKLVALQLKLSSPYAKIGGNIIPPIPNPNIANPMAFDLLELNQLFILAITDRNPGGSAPVERIRKNT